MAIAWFLAKFTVINNPSGWPYYRRIEPWREYLADIASVNGVWAGAECLGNHLVAKIRASQETLDAIAALPDVIRLPKNLLSASLSDLTAQQKTVIVNKLQEMGYPLSEIRDSLGNNVGTKTLGDVLRFAAKRRLTPRFDKDQGVMVLDGAERSTKSIDLVDDEVSNS